MVLSNGGGTKMKVSIRFVRKEGKCTLEVIDLKYKNKVVASLPVTSDEARYLISELAKEL
jgi:hypothetical protein